jgi:hypothetical protein
MEQATITLADLRASVLVLTERCDQQRRELDALALVSGANRDKRLQWSAIIAAGLLAVGLLANAQSCRASMSAAPSPTGSLTP